MTVVLDLEAIDEPDRSFDIVLCRDGLMLVPDPARAAAEIRRVGGRLVVAVWGAPERNPWLSTIFRIVEPGDRDPGAAARHAEPVRARRSKPAPRRAR